VTRTAQPGTVVKLYAALLAILFSGGCDIRIGKPPEHPEVHRWALTPTKLLEQRDCAGSLQHLLDVDAERRNGLWYSLFVGSYRMCASHAGKKEYFTTVLLDTFRQDERVHGENPSFRLWYGAGLRGLGRREAAEEQFKLARGLAERTLADSASSPEARSESEAVLQSLR
jgi:hypothetical protein